MEEEKSYLEIPYRSLSNPAISLFEHRLALKKLKAKGKEQVNENNLFRAIDEMRHIVKTSASKTRAMRKNRTRIQENAKIQKHHVYMVQACSTTNPLDCGLAPSSLISNRTSEPSRVTARDACL